jgi:hypothetical protein
VLNLVLLQTLKCYMQFEVLTAVHGKGILTAVHGKGILTL